MKYLLLAAVAALTASAAAAQDNPDYRVRVGVGAQIQPDFIGAKSTDIAPLFHVKTARGTNFFKFGAPDDRAGIGLVGKGGFSAGPAFALASGLSSSAGHSRRTSARSGAPSRPGCSRNIKRAIVGGFEAS